MWWGVDDRTTRCFWGSSVFLCGVVSGTIDFSGYLFSVDFGSNFSDIKIRFVEYELMGNTVFSVPRSGVCGCEVVARFNVQRILRGGSQSSGWHSKFFLVMKLV